LNNNPFAPDVTHPVSVIPHVPRRYPMYFTLPFSSHQFFSLLPSTPPHYSSLLRLPNARSLLLQLAYDKPPRHRIKMKATLFALGAFASLAAANINFEWVQPTCKFNSIEASRCLSGQQCTPQDTCAPISKSDHSKVSSRSRSFLRLTATKQTAKYSLDGKCGPANGNLLCDPKSTTYTGACCSQYGWVSRHMYNSHVRHMLTSIVWCKSRSLRRRLPLWLQQRRGPLSSGACCKPAA
jgi:hypothetical protein